MRRIALALSLVLTFGAAPICPAQAVQAVPPKPGSPATDPSRGGESKRPMTFEDLMKMKRLGETAVSPDGKWLAYSVTTVDLEQNTKTAELWIQAIAGGEPQPLAVAKPGDSGVQFSADGKHILFLSSREGGQQVWLADFDPTTGAASNAKKLTNISTEANNARWSPDGHSVLFTSSVYPDCPAISPADGGVGDKCNLADVLRMRGGAAQAKAEQHEEVESTSAQKPLDGTGPDRHITKKLTHAHPQPFQSCIGPTILDAR